MSMSGVRFRWVFRAEGAGAVRIRKSWRTPVVAGLALVLCTGLTACSGSSDDDTPDSTKGQGKGKVEDPSKPETVTFFSWVGNQPQMKKMAKEFHADHPNITIKFENAPAEQAGQVLSTRIAGN